MEPEIEKKKMVLVPAGEDKSDTGIKDMNGCKGLALKGENRHSINISLFYSIFCIRDGSISTA